MIPLRLSEIARVVGGVLHGHDVVVAGPAYVDSRSPVPDGLFVAIVGERADGHAYADGAHAVLGSRPTSAPTVVVQDPVVALGLLARHLLDRLDTTVIALTGSQGKTGTKDYLAAVLRILTSEQAVVATTANNNNELGVPLTVLRADATTSHVVVEMGARGVGHIAYLCEIAPPQIAAALNVGSAHVGEFGGQEVIAQAKGEIIAALPDDGVAVLNADDPLVASMAARTSARIVSFGTTGAVTWRNLTLDALGRPTFELGYDDQWHAVTLLQSGAHQVLNAAAAAAMAIGAGFAPADVAAALGTAAAASRWRMEVTERADGLVVINDSYNANPESMRAALEALVAIGRGDGGPRRRTVAILGEMKELGDEHEAGHRAVGRAAADLGVDVLVVVTAAARGIADGAQPVSGNTVDEVIVTAGRDDAVDWVRQNAGPEDVVLVKASRGAALELVAESILEETAQ
ncbi:UDP-N-acetylmuramoyl-tripeptide--D-alanyl-D-alanine ligase [Nocardioides sp. WS12]|uniref:UDP-N-acetylmuramoyl-tripeptide--D-alanyl-D- alanine ligase n=1 Tax=Nocardioides sp. WS12 TaxID=2486272 RepID=UPI0015FC821D|nr:UDP-N-acetylmuramoyl-tripeptide--D-alanyl-D-alanine ligase [Nocardioides sp. WS12]